MGWGILGAERIANLRAYLYNGGDFSELHFKTKNKELKKKKVVAIKKWNYNGIPRGIVVGRDGITNFYSAKLRKILRKK